MQSWQTDLLNIWLRTTIKPLLRRARSIERVRRVVSLIDNSFGRLSIPGTTRIETVFNGQLNCRCDWVDNNDSPTDRVILYLPGGAYIMRTPNTHTGMIARLCVEAQARAFVCYYRLAPEHTFPACLDDSVAAYDWLLKQGYRPEQISIAGDSAGGGLTLSTLLKLRDLQRPMPACARLISPLLDAGDIAPSRIKHARSDSTLPSASERGINPRPLFIGTYDAKDPMISPIYGDFHDLPPMYVLVSDSEMLTDDSLRLARRAQLYKVPVRVDIWRKVPHVWTAMAFLPEARDGLERAGKFIIKHIPYASAKGLKASVSRLTPQTKSAAQRQSTSS